jgi:cellulase/cellobiase CelA1
MRRADRDPDHQRASAGASPSAVLSCHVKYAKQSEWKPGFVADITVTNTGALAIDGWEMTFAYTAGQKMTNGWNAIVTQEGDTIRAEAAGGNTRIDPNASLTFGLQGTWSGRNPMPSAFVLNGVRCSTPY